MQILAKEMAEARRRLNGQDSLLPKTGSALQQVVASQTIANSAAGDRLVSRAFKSLNSYDLRLCKYVCVLNVFIINIICNKHVINRYVRLRDV